MSEKNGPGCITGGELICNRILNAPRSAVWPFLADPELLKNWWLPEGAHRPRPRQECPRRRLWPFRQEEPAEAPKESETVQVETDKPSQIAFEHGSGFPFGFSAVNIEDLPDHTRLTLQLAALPEGDAVSAPLLRIENPHRVVFHHEAWPVYSVVATLEEAGERTRVRFEARFASTEDFEALRDLAYLGAEQAFHRIELKLVKLTGGEVPRDFMLRRSFNAPIDLVWKFWTQHEHLAKWWGPKAASMSNAQMDFRRGGSFHFRMQAPDGFETWGKLRYVDIVKPERILWVNSFSDQEGGIQRHPAVYDFPLEILGTAAFEQQQDQTVVVVRWRPINANATEIDVFNYGTASTLRKGWEETFDRLDRALTGFREGRWAPKQGQAWEESRS